MRLIWLTSLPNFSAQNPLQHYDGRGGSATGYGGLNLVSWKFKQPQNLFILGWCSPESSSGAQAKSDNGECLATATTETEQVKRLCLT